MPDQSVDPGSSALQRVRDSIASQQAEIEREWDVARLPARRGEVPIEEAIRQLMPTFWHVVMAESLVCAANEGSLSQTSPAVAIGARSQAEAELYCADWILRGALRDPSLMDQDAPCSEREARFTEVCTKTFNDMGVGRDPRRTAWDGMFLMVLVVISSMAVGAVVMLGGN